MLAVCAWTCGDAWEPSFTFSRWSRPDEYISVLSDTA